MTLREYIASLANKRVAVIGIGVSNQPLLELLATSGAEVTACDKKERAAFGALADELEAKGITLRLGENYLDDLDADIVFRSPGIRPDIPAFEAVRRRGGVITSEMEIFFRVCPCRIIGITGSDGKTTTSSIIAEMLRAAGKRVHLGGNIGHPLLCEADNMCPDDIAVVELSSFQLLDMTRSPQVAVLTNLAPNHLDVHKDMAEYIAAKENIYLHQSAADRAIFNMDNAITAELSRKANAQVTGFSAKGESDIFAADGFICRKRGEAAEKVLALDEIRLPGAHNVENYMAAIAAVDGLVSDEVIRAVARDFAGVEHRIEFVRELDGVKYYNDSIASSPTRTIAGLRAFTQKVILIAGGYDKHIPFTELGPEVVAHVKTLILCGATAQSISDAVTACEEYQSAAEKPEIVFCASLDEAVQRARAAAKSGDIVALSPACAAFDQFPNFMVRGKKYKELVNSLE